MTWFHGSVAKTPSSEPSMSKLEKESYLKLVTGKSSSKKTVNIKASDMIKKRPEGEESTADEADVSDTEKVIFKLFLHVSKTR